MEKLIAVVGPTASGKSALAIELAQRFNGEIISCDSMQIYKYLDIGTAKPTKEELAKVAHHMIDVIDPQKCPSYSCAEFVIDAQKAIEDVLERGKVPILCGGTGLYVDSIVYATEFSRSPAAPEYRAELFDTAQRYGNEYVYEMLKKVDPESAEATHPNNLKRVIRALEIYHSSGITKTEWDRNSHEKAPRYDVSMIGISYSNREKLYERINSRVDAMVELGLINEVKHLLDSGILSTASTAAQAIGYKEIIHYLNGETSLEEAIENVKRESRRYAKRQMTWFSRNDNIHWINPDEFDDNEDRFKIIVNNAVKYLTENDFCAII